MKDIIDPTHAGSFLPLNPDEMEAALETHERLTGLRPRAEQEPSAEQLGALAAKLRASEPPYVDFSLWGPFDRRTAKDRKSLAMVWVDGGTPAQNPEGPSELCSVGAALGCLRRCHALAGCLRRGSPRPVQGED